MPSGKALWQRELWSQDFRNGTGEKQGRSPGEDCPRSYNRESLRAMGTVTNDPTEAQRLWEDLGRVGSGQEGAAH